MRNKRKAKKKIVHTEFGLIYFLSSILGISILGSLPVETSEQERREFDILGHTFVRGLFLVGLLVPRSLFPSLLRPIDLQLQAMDQGPHPHPHLHPCWHLHRCHSSCSGGFVWGVPDRHLMPGAYADGLGYLPWDLVWGP